MYWFFFLWKRKKFVLIKPYLFSWKWRELDAVPFSCSCKAPDLCKPYFLSRYDKKQSKNFASETLGIFSQSFFVLCFFFQTYMAYLSVKNQSVASQSCSKICSHLRSVRAFTIFHAFFKLQSTKKNRPFQRRSSKNKKQNKT